MQLLWCGTVESNIAVLQPHMCYTRTHFDTHTGMPISSPAEFSSRKLQNSTKCTTDPRRLASRQCAANHASSIEKLPHANVIASQYVLAQKCFEVLVVV